MNLYRLGMLGSLLLAFLVVTAHAEEPAPVAWGATSPAFGPCGLNIPAGTLAMGGNVLFAKSNGIWKNDERLNGNVKATKFNEIFKVRYGIMDGLDIRSATPVYNVHLDKKTDGNRETYGIGDTTLLLHKGLLSQRKGDPLSVALDFGGVLPTGSVGEHSSNAAGNSAWGFVGGLGATYFYEANRFDTEINFATFTEGAKDYEKGNRVRWNLGYAYALNDHWDIGAEATWEMGDESKYQGQGQKNTYVEWYAGPKATFKYKPWKLNVGLIAQAPIHRWYEGNKIGSDDYRFSLKLMKAFNFNKLFD